MQHLGIVVVVVGGRGGETGLHLRKLVLHKKPPFLSFLRFSMYTQTNSYYYSYIAS